MRRKDRELSLEETKQVLAAGEYGILSTVCSDGKPYGVPVSYAYDQAAGRIYIHGTSQESLRNTNMLAHPAVCFTVIGPTKVLPDKFSTLYSSAVVFGKARKVEDKDEKVQSLIKVVEKYSPDYMKEGLAYIDRALDAIAVFVIEDLTMTGKAKKK